MARLADGSFKFPLANLSLFAFSLPFLEKAAAHSPSLPLHLAKKAASFLDEAGPSTLFQATIAHKSSASSSMSSPWPTNPPPRLSKEPLFRPPQERSRRRKPRLPPRKTAGPPESPLRIDQRHPHPSRFPLRTRPRFLLPKQRALSLLARPRHPFRLLCRRRGLCPLHPRQRASPLESLGF